MNFKSRDSVLCVASTSNSLNRNNNSSWEEINSDWINCRMVSNRLVLFLIILRYFAAKV